MVINCYWYFKYSKYFGCLIFLRLFVSKVTSIRQLFMARFITVLLIWLSRHFQSILFGTWRCLVSSPCRVRRLIFVRLIGSCNTP